MPAAGGTEPDGVLVRLGGVHDVDELVRLHHAGLVRLAWVLCGDTAEAEDLVAEAYARAWPRLRRGGVDDPVAYLRRSVVNGAASWRRRLVLVRREERRRRVAPPPPDPLGRLAERDRLAAALQALTAQQRQVLGLRYVADLSEAETAACLGVAAGTVKSRTSRALAVLRAALDDEGEQIDA